jgi:hypothetical protein
MFVVAHTGIDDVLGLGCMTSNDCLIDLLHSSIIIKG